MHQAHPNQNHTQFVFDFESYEKKYALSIVTLKWTALYTLPDAPESALALFV